MLKRIHIKGYKSLRDVEVHLQPLTVLFGPNASGKSNFLDALQLLSRLVASPSIKEAFGPPCRGKPLEAFSLPPEGLKGLRAQESVALSIEVDFRLSDFVVGRVNELIEDMQSRHEIDVSESSRSTADMNRVEERRWAPAEAKQQRIEAKDFRYRIEIEMQPNTGLFRVLDERLVEMDDQGNPLNGLEHYFLSTPAGALEGEDKAHRRVWMRKGTDKLAVLNVGVDQSALSQHIYPSLFPYLAAVREEISGWSFFYFEPRERMRTPNPVKAVRHIGLMGEELAAYLNTLKAENPRQFEVLEKSLKLTLPRIEGIEVGVNDHGEIEWGLREDGVLISARALSEGTLRNLGLLALGTLQEPPALIGLEGPEVDIYPRQIELVVDFLKTQSDFMDKTQYIVTTHSPVLIDWVSKESLFVVKQGEKGTQIDPLSAFGPLGHRLKEGAAPAEPVWDDADDDDLPPFSVGDRTLRGDFDD